MQLNRIADLPVGSELRTSHGNRLRLFQDGWSPLNGAHWDRWTVYSDWEVWTNFSGLERA